VDDARELRERAPTAPAMGRERVYILDEAQRLSREAFDALLKLFEEPPSGRPVRPGDDRAAQDAATIVGRCQRFDFRRIGTDELAGLLERVADNEGWKLDRSAAESLARQAEGSARDAESLLDQSAVLSAGRHHGRHRGDADRGRPVRRPVRARRRRRRRGFAERLPDRRPARAERPGSAPPDLGGPVPLPDLIIVQAAPDEPGRIDVAPDEHARLAAQAAKFTTAELSRVVSLLLAAQADMRWTTSPRLSLELALVRSTIPRPTPPPPAWPRASSGWSDSPASLTRRLSPRAVRSRRGDIGVPAVTDGRAGPDL
jgi:DNA polymerase-3 subunit gamma/tau